MPIEWAEKAAATRKAPAISRIQPMKIAVPTAATAGTRIAMQPTTIASTPTVISAFQLRARPVAHFRVHRRSSDLHDENPKRRRGRSTARTSMPRELA